MSLLTFLIVDDAPSYREILRELVESQPSWTIVGEASNGLEAIEFVARQPVDIICMDVNMPLINGIEATRRIKHLSPQTRILLFTGYNDDEFRAESILAGADHFARKEELDHEYLSHSISVLLQSS